MMYNMTYTEHDAYGIQTTWQDSLHYKYLEAPKRSVPNPFFSRVIAPHNRNTTRVQYRNQNLNRLELAAPITLSNVGHNRDARVCFHEPIELDSTESLLFGPLEPNTRPSDDHKVVHIGVREENNGHQLLLTDGAEIKVFQSYWQHRNLRYQQSAYHIFMVNMLSSNNCRYWYTVVLRYDCLNNNVPRPYVLRTDSLPGHFGHLPFTRNQLLALGVPQNYFRVPSMELSLPICDYSTPVPTNQTEFMAISDSLPGSSTFYREHVHPFMPITSAPALPTQDFPPIAGRVFNQITRGDTLLDHLLDPPPFVRPLRLTLEAGGDVMNQTNSFESNRSNLERESLDQRVNNPFGDMVMPPVTVRDVVNQRFNNIIYRPIDYTNSANVSARSAAGSTSSTTGSSRRRGTNYHINRENIMSSFLSRPYPSHRRHPPGFTWSMGGIETFSLSGFNTRRMHPERQQRNEERRKREKLPENTKTAEEYKDLMVSQGDTLNSGDLNGMKCNVCWDSFVDILKEKRSLVSTICGHVFCENCMEKNDASNALMLQQRRRQKCPVCRELLPSPAYFRIYLPLIAVEDNNENAALQNSPDSSTDSSTDGPVSRSDSGQNEVNDIHERIEAERQPAVVG